MYYIISNEKEFFSIKKSKKVLIYTDQFELFIKLKKLGIKYIFSNFIYSKKNNSDEIITEFCRNWHLDNENKDIFEFKGISIALTISRRMSIKFIYILRAYFALKILFKKKSSIKISSQCNDILISAIKMLQNAKVVNYNFENNKLALSHSPDRGKGFIPKIYLMGKILRQFQKLIIKNTIIFFSDATSIYSGSQNNQILIKNSFNIFKSFFFCKNTALVMKYEEILSKKFNNCNKNIIFNNIKKILNLFSISNKSSNDIAHIFFKILKQDLKINKNILANSLSIYEDLIMFYKPKYIIQNGESGFNNILISEFCRLYKIKNFLLLDGYQFFVDKFIFFKTTYKKKFSFDKVFAYGSANAKIYLKQGFKKKQIVKINSPILDNLKITKGKSFAKLIILFKKLLISNKKPMILGYQPNCNCYQTPFDIQLKIELDLIKLLQDLKFESVVVKLKDGDKTLSGSGIKSSKYYKVLFEQYFGEKMTINLEVKMGSLFKNFKKTKFIIGGFSTSIIEAMKCRVPYYFYEPIEGGYKKKTFNTIELFDKDKIANNLFTLKKNINNNNFIPFKMQNLSYSKSLSHFNFKDI
jgi:hypothetical protein